MIVTGIHYQVKTFPTAAGITASFVAITEPTNAPLPR